MIPYSLSFYSDISKEAYHVFTMFYIVDIFVGFNSSYFRHGNLVVDRSKIAIFYMKNWFFIDLVSAFPTELLVYIGYNYDFPKFFDFSKDFSRIFLLLKVLKCLKL